MKKILLVALASLSSLVSVAQWQITGGPQSAGHISSLAAKDSTVFAGTETGGIFTSTNGGTSWSAGNTGLTNMNDVRSLATDDSTVFSGVYNSLGGVAVFSSTNNAASWSPANLSFLFCFSLAVKPGLLIAGTWDGVSVSTDRGSNWNNFITGLPGNASVSALAFDGTKIFCGVSGSSSGGTGVFYSTDNGASWNPFNTGLTNTTVYKLAVVGSTVIAGTSGGAFLSSTSGANWSAVTGVLAGANIKSLFAYGSDLFAGTSGGIFYSGNAGSTWADISSGLPVGATIYSITSDSAYLFAGSDSVVYRRLLSEVISGTADKNNLEHAISLFPNPSSTEFLLTIETPQQSSKEKFEVSLYDLPGEKIVQQSLDGENKLLIHVQSLPPGIYFIQITDAALRSVTKKLVKM